MPTSSSLPTPLGTHSLPSELPIPLGTHSLPSELPPDAICLLPKLLPADAVCLLAEELLADGVYLYAVWTWPFMTDWLNHDVIVGGCNCWQMVFICMLSGPGLSWLIDWTTMLLLVVVMVVMFCCRCRHHHRSGFVSGVFCLPLHVSLYEALEGLHFSSLRVWHVARALLMARALINDTWQERYWWQEHY
jgi:hypothetical protein